MGESALFYFRLLFSILTAGQDRLPLGSESVSSLALGDYAVVDRVINHLKKDARRTDPQNSNHPEC